MSHTPSATPAITATASAQRFQGAVSTSRIAERSVNRTVLRAAPCLFGLYTVVALLFVALPEHQRSGGVSWPGKERVTFSDALACVRRRLWSEWVFPRAGAGRAIEKLPEPVRELVLSALAPAA